MGGYARSLDKGGRSRRKPVFWRRFESPRFSGHGETAPAKAGARPTQTSRGLLRTGDRDAVTAYRIISEEKASGVAVTVACERLEVSRSGCYEWATRVSSDREALTGVADGEIRQTHIEEFDSRRRRHSTLGMLSRFVFEAQHTSPSPARENVSGMFKALRVSSINDDYYNVNDQAFALSAEVSGEAGRSK